MNVVPKGIKKRTTAVIREELEKVSHDLHDKEAAIKKAKEDYESKVKKLKADISADKKRLSELRKEYQQLVRNEQRETLSAMMFNGDLSPSDINAALNALSVLFSGSGDKTAAIQRLQEIADEQDNSTISNLVNEIGNENE